MGKAVITDRDVKRWDGGKAAINKYRREGRRLDMDLKLSDLHNPSWSGDLEHFRETKREAYLDAGVIKGAEKCQAQSKDAQNVTPT